MPVIDAQGWIDGVLQLPSPNCDPRPEGAGIDLVVVHAISLPPDRFGGAGISALFTNALDPDLHPYFREIAALRVSAHALVRRDGRVVQYVPFGLRAWHAGASNWMGRERCNDFSVGIELEGTDEHDFDPRQYATLNSIVRALRLAYGVGAIAGHSDIAPGRKTDPGPRFDWMQMSSSEGMQKIVAKKINKLLA
jgi:N-acetyl-anhydromuramoyl-L-alanine amidase